MVTTRLAIESEPVTTDVIMVNLFPYLAIRHQVGNIPTTVVNAREKIGGPLDEEAYLGRILAAASSR